MKIYSGSRMDGSVSLSLNGQPLAVRSDLIDYGSEFDWRCIGPPSAATALAILADYLGDQKAIELHRKFQIDIVAYLSTDHWTIGEDMIDVLLTGGANSFL